MLRARGLDSDSVRTRPEKIVQRAWILPASRMSIHAKPADRRRTWGDFAGRAFGGIGPRDEHADTRARAASVVTAESRQVVCADAQRRVGAFILWPRELVDGKPVDGDRVSLRAVEPDLHMNRCCVSAPPCQNLSTGLLAHPWRARLLPEEQADRCKRCRVSDGHYNGRRLQIALERLNEEVCYKRLVIGGSCHNTNCSGSSSVDLDPNMTLPGPAWARYRGQPLDGRHIDSPTLKPVRSCCTASLVPG